MTTSFTDLANVTLEKCDGPWGLSKMGREWCTICFFYGTVCMFDNYLLEGLNNLFAYPNWVWWLTLILQPDTVGEVLLITWFFYGLEPTVIFHHLPNLPDVQISPWSGRDMLSPATTDAPSQVRGPDCYRHLPGHSKCWKETSVATNHWYLHSSYLHIFDD